MSKTQRGTIDETTRKDSEREEEEEKKKGKRSTGRFFMTTYRNTTDIYNNIPTTPPFFITVCYILQTPTLHSLEERNDIKISFHHPQKERKKRNKHGTKTMCYNNIGALLCISCSRKIGEVTMGSQPCSSACGLFVSRNVPEMVQSECAVCKTTREASAEMAAKMKKFSSK